jgi:hypothetical protein
MALFFHPIAKSAVGHWRAVVIQFVATAMRTWNLLARMPAFAVEGARDSALGSPLSVSNAPLIPQIGPLKW